MMNNQVFSHIKKNNNKNKENFKEVVQIVGNFEVVRWKLVNGILEVIGEHVKDRAIYN